MSIARNSSQSGLAKCLQAFSTQGADPLCRFYTIVNPPFFIYCAKIMDFSETSKQSPRIFRSTMYTTDSCHIKISSLALN